MEPPNCGGIPLDYLEKHGCPLTYHDNLCVECRYMEANVEQKEVVTLKEYIEKQICNLQKWTKDRFDMQAEALKLQAYEYERRLSILNNENERILAAQNKSVPRERYDVEIANIIDRLSKLERYGYQNTAEKAGKASVWTVILAVAALLFGLSGIIISLILR